jgi:hypothetical protein
MGCRVKGTEAVMLLALLSSAPLMCQSPQPVGSTPAAAFIPSTAQNAAPAVTSQGGTIRGTVVAGSLGKTGAVPLPGVSVTATNTLTGKKYTTSTDIDGVYTMKIPHNGRYVVRAELTGFAAKTQEAMLTGVEAEAAQQSIAIVAKPTDFSMELASREAAEEAKAATSSTSTATSLARGMQSLGLSAGGADAMDASAGSGNTGTSMPTLAGLGDSAQATDSVAVSGQTGQTNGLANFSEDEIRQRVEDAVAQGRASGMIPQGGDPTNAIVGMLGGMMSGGGFGGGGGGRGGGGRGGGGGGGFGSGAFRNFNPSQPHGSIFYQGGNSELNSSTWSAASGPDLPHFVANPSAYSNRFGVTIAASPYIPGLTKPNTKQFVFLNFTGQKNLNAFLASGRVPTPLERDGNFSQSEQKLNGVLTPVTIYDPATGSAFGNDTVPTLPSGVCTPGLSCITNVAQNLLKFYPQCNINCTNLDPTVYNYQTISNAGSNNVAINTRYVRTLGGTSATPFGSFGGGGGGGRRGGGGNSNAPPSLRQNINLSYNFSHSAQDNRNIFLPLGGANESNGNALNAGYTIGYGRLSNNASVTWNRSSAETRNYFTNTQNNPSTTAGLTINNLSGGFADPNFYNGLPTLSISNFQTLSNQTPSETINQTISFSDFVAYRHKKHNVRVGLDIRRVHADSIGGNNPLGSFSFTGYATESPTDQTLTTQNASGSGFADFLLGLPQSTSIQAGLYKIYLRENVYDWYLTDDYRVSSNWTLNYGLRYEYFGPYSEKNGRLVNLTGVNGVTPPAASGIGCTTPNGTSYTAPTGTITCAASGNRSLVNPDYAMYSPRFGFAWKPKFTKDTVVRGGYGINYNTGQYAVFAKSLSHQPPFSLTETNDVPVTTTSNPNPAATGCTTTHPGNTTPTLTLANGFGPAGSRFGCSTQESFLNNYAVDKNYRLGMVQLFNLNIQRTLPLQIVFNIGYNGSFGRNLDVVGAPNATPAGVSTAGVEPFDYEESAATSRSNQLVVSAQKRQQKGIALGVTYTYSHSIDNASGVGGAVGSPIQNLFNIAAEEGNSSFDQRHNLTGNWLLELPFGPNRAYFNKGGFLSHAVDGFNLSGTFTFATGTYLTPQYSGNVAEASSGNTYQQRPNRNFAVSTKGSGKVGDFFNTAAFSAPCSVPAVNNECPGTVVYGSASPGSIEGPGTVSVNASLSRTVQLGGTSSFEARVTATNVFNTVQYSGINTTENSATFGEVTSAAAMRSLLVQARYRF